MLELRQVERQCRCRKRHLLRNLSGRQAVRTSLYQQAEDAQARLLGERLEGNDDSFGFHISNIMELLAAPQARDENRR